MHVKQMLRACLLGVAVGLVVIRSFAYTSDVQAVTATVTNTAASVFLMPSEVYSNMTVTASNRTSDCNYQLAATDGPWTYEFEYLDKSSTAYLTFVSKRDSSGEGFDIHYYEDAQLSKYMDYSSNSLNGLMTEFHPNGQASIVTYMSNDCFLGEMVQFDEQGQVVWDHVITNATPMTWSIIAPE